MSSKATFRLAATQAIAPASVRQVRLVAVPPRPIVRDPVPAEPNPARYIPLAERPEELRHYPPEIRWMVVAAGLDG